MTAPPTPTQALEAIAGWYDFTAATWKQTFPEWNARHAELRAEADSKEPGDEEDLHATIRLFIEIAREGLGGGQ